MGQDDHIHLVRIDLGRRQLCRHQLIAGQPDIEEQGDRVAEFARAGEVGMHPGVEQHDAFGMTDQPRGHGELHRLFPGAQFEHVSTRGEGATGQRRDGDGHVRSLARSGRRRIASSAADLTPLSCVAHSLGGCACWSWKTT